MKYDDIINIPYQKSKKHKQMSLNDRAAQFLPFAALTGFETAIKEVEYEKISKIKLNDDTKNQLNSKLNLLINLHLKEPITITYYLDESKKSHYVTITKNIRRIDEVNKQIIFTDQTKVSINSIIEISSDTLNYFFNEFINE